jgi:hypothetical protein
VSTAIATTSDPLASVPLNRLRLSDFPTAFAAIDAVIDELGGELPEDVEARLDAMDVAFETKCDGVAWLIRQADSEVAFWRPEYDRITKRLRAAQHRSARLRNYLQSTMEALGRDKVETGRFSVRLQKNSTPSIRWPGDLAELPDHLKCVEVSLDGKAAREALKAGTLPEGFEVVVGRHLRIS